MDTQNRYRLFWMSSMPGSQNRFRMSTFRMATSPSPPEAPGSQNTP